MAKQKQNVTPKDFPKTQARQARAGVQHDRRLTKLRSHNQGKEHSKMNHPQSSSTQSIPAHEGSPEQDDIRELEMSFAYDHASSLIEGHCVPFTSDDPFRPWFDLSTREIDLADETRYLQARNLLEVHPTNRAWVRVCNESEPLTQAVN